MSCGGVAVDVAVGAFLAGALMVTFRGGSGGGGGMLLELDVVGRGVASSDDVGLIT